MTRRIAHLIEEHENRSKLFRTMDVEVERTQEESQETETPAPDREEVLPLKPRKESQQREVTMLRRDKNQNGKRNNETKITGKRLENSVRRKQRTKSYRRFKRELRRRKIYKTGTSLG
jgi:hypothetical protein